MLPAIMKNIQDDTLAAVAPDQVIYFIKLHCVS